MAVGDEEMDREELWSQTKQSYCMVIAVGA